MATSSVNIASVLLFFIVIPTVVASFAISGGLNDLLGLHDDFHSRLSDVPPMLKLSVPSSNVFSVCAVVSTPLPSIPTRGEETDWPLKGAAVCPCMCMDASAASSRRRLSSLARYATRTENAGKRERIASLLSALYLRLCQNRPAASGLSVPYKQGQHFGNDAPPQVQRDSHIEKD